MCIRTSQTRCVLPSGRVLGCVIMIPNGFQGSGFRELPERFFGLLAWLAAIRWTCMRTSQTRCVLISHNVFEAVWQKSTPPKIVNLSCIAPNMKNKSDGFAARVLC